MEFTVEELASGICVINLIGRMDLKGALEIDLKFTAVAAGAKGRVLVDMSQVEYLASIGIRTLVSVAKAQKQRGGALALCGAQSLVANTLEMAGMQSIVPVLPDREAGLAALAEAVH